MCDEREEEVEEGVAVFIALEGLRKFIPALKLLYSFLYHIIIRNFTRKSDTQ